MKPAEYQPTQSKYKPVNQRLDTNDKPLRSVNTQHIERMSVGYDIPPKQEGKSTCHVILTNQLNNGSKHKDQTGQLYCMITSHLSIILMAKAARPGMVKTRMQQDFSPEQAAFIHFAMLECVLARIQRHMADDTHTDFVFALDNSQSTKDMKNTIPANAEAWRIVDQGQGNLGQRILNVLTALDPGPVIIFGADSPDVPAEILGRIRSNISIKNSVIGPTQDGGYWCLGAKELDPRLLDQIDWGTPDVYDQTLQAAAKHGIKMDSLPVWYDVDFPEDLVALRARIATSDEPELIHLAEELDRIEPRNRVMH